MQLGDLIQSERKDLKVSQEELASRLMRSQDWMSLVERNKLEPLQEDLENIAKEQDKAHISYVCYKGGK